MNPRRTAPRWSARRPAPLSAGLLTLALAAGACSRAPKEVALKLAAVDAPLRYDKPELKVPANSKVTLTFKNAAAAQSHNFVLVQPGTADAVSAAAASRASEHEYIPSHYAVIANSPSARPGEKVTASFMAPPAGSYEFLCTIPGHPPLRGTFIVQ